MTGLASLAGTTSLMFLGSYLAGLLPLAAQASSTGSKNIRIVNALGAGLLLGAALCVVLPEGFVTFLEGQEKLDMGSRYPEWMMGLALLLGFLTMLGLQLVAEQWEGPEEAAGSARGRAGAQASGPHASGAALAASSSQRVDAPAEEERLLGLGPAGARASSIDALEVSGSSARPPAALSAADQALYGLVIHSAADGIAVGAACLSNSLALTTSIGAAILIHKFPVAFGLSSFLRGAGWSGPRLQKGLLLFCSAAPLAAIVVYALFGRVATMTDERTVALCLLFSGGTVLHAGLVHVLPSVLGRGNESHASHMHGGEEHGRVHVQDRRGNLMVMATLVGASLLPLVISALLPES